MPDPTRPSAVSMEATLAPGPRSPDLLPENRPYLQVGDQLLLWWSPFCEGGWCQQEGA